MEAPDPPESPRVAGAEDPGGARRPPPRVSENNAPRVAGICVAVNTHVVFPGESRQAAGGGVVGGGGRRGGALLTTPWIRLQVSAGSLRTYQAFVSSRAEDCSACTAFSMQQTPV